MLTIRSLLAATLVSFVSAALPSGATLQSKDDMVVMKIMSTSETPLITMMGVCGLPPTRLALERFLKHSEGALVSDGKEPLLSVYPLMKAYFEGMNRYIPQGLEYSEPEVIENRIAEVARRPHDRVVKSFTNPTISSINSLGCTNEAIVGSYSVKAIGNCRDKKRLAVNTAKKSKDGPVGELCSFNLKDREYRVISVIPDLGVSLVVVRKQLARSGSSFFVEVWRGVNDRIRLSYIRCIDADHFALKLSADRSHFYIVFLAPSGFYRVLVGSTIPFTYLEETPYKSHAPPVIDGDYLEMDGRLINLASFWTVGKTDLPLPEDFVLRSGDKIELVDISRSRLVDIFRRNCMDFGSMLPDAREVRVMQLRHICSLLIGSTRNELRALELIDQFTTGRRRSDADVTRMFGEVIDGRIPLAEDIELKPKGRRPFPLIEDAPTSLPSTIVVSKLLTRYDTELAKIAADEEFKIDVDVLTELLASRE